MEKVKQIRLVSFDPIFHPVVLRGDRLRNARAGLVDMLVILFMLWSGLFLTCIRIENGSVAPSTKGSFGPFLPIAPEFEKECPEFEQECCEEVEMDYTSI